MIEAWTLQEVSPGLETGLVLTRELPLTYLRQAGPSREAGAAESDI